MREKCFKCGDDQDLLEGAPRVLRHALPQLKSPIEIEVPLICANYGIEIRSSILGCLKGPTTCSSWNNARSTCCRAADWQNFTVRRGSFDVSAIPGRFARRATVEAFPTTFLGVMIECPAQLKRPKSRSDRYFAHLAEHHCIDRFVQRLLGGRKCIHDPRDVKNHDDRAALIGALTALAVVAGEFTGVGDEEDGWIILPPQWAFAAWAWAAACATARDEAPGQESAPAGKLLSFSENQPSRFGTSSPPA